VNDAITEPVLLALIALATLIVTNLFAIWRTSVMSSSVDRVEAKLGEVHTAVAAQPDRTDLTAAVAPLIAQLNGNGGGEKT
jgi:uncharacterized membrane protein